MSSPHHRNSPYRFLANFNVRPPTPPGTFHGNNLWRSQNIDLGSCNDSASRDEGFLSKTSDSGFDDRREEDFALNASTKGTQVEDIKCSSLDALNGSVSDTFGSTRFLRASSNSPRIGDFNNYHYARYPYDPGYGNNEVNGTSLRCCSPAVFIPPGRSLEQFQQLCCSGDMHHAGGFPVSCRPLHPREAAQNRRRTVSRSLILEDRRPVQCISPHPNEYNTVALSSSRASPRCPDMSSLSDSNTCRSKNVAVQRNGHRSQLGRFSDSSTSSLSNVGTVAAKKKVRATSRVRSSSRYHNSTNSCTLCNEHLSCYDRQHCVALHAASIHAEDQGSHSKVQQLDSEKKNLMLQVSVLNDQVDAQAEKIREFETLIIDKQTQLHQLEQELHQEVMTRSAVENSKLELMTEISNLRLRLTAAERDRKESDEKYRRIENNLNSLTKNDSKQFSYKAKSCQNGTLLSQLEANAEIEKLNHALDTVMSSNDEKDKKIEDLRIALVKYKKLHDLVVAGQQKKDFSIKETQVGEEEFLQDSPLYAAIGENSKVKFIGKQSCFPRNHVGTVMTALHTEHGDSANVSAKSSYPFHRSSSLENLRQEASKPSESPYGTMPRQSGQLVLQNLQERLQKHESSGTSSQVRSIHNSRDMQASPTPSSTSTKNRIRHIIEEPQRPSRNKSSGVSFGKGFFKLRLGKRSSSAPELAPFENVAILDRESSSTTPTPQPTMQPFFIKPEKERSKNILKFFTKWKRTGSQNIEKIEEEFRRGGVRSTAGPRLGWSREISINLDIPFPNWNSDALVEWFHKIGLSMYISELKRWRCNGQRLLNSTPHELERELNMKHPLHKKKLSLALKGFKGVDSLPSIINNLDYQWVVRWLDDVGLPQYKDSFSEARVDGRVLHFLTVDDLLYLKVTNQLHHVSIKRGIQVLREKNFEPHCLIRRSIPDEDKSFTPESVSLWTNHRVMEWLRTVDLSEYAPNMRGSGVHGALIVYEPKFNSDLFATLLNIPPTKTLLRRHLATHFKTIVGAEQSQAKRDLETDQLNMPLTPNVKIKNTRRPQFALKKKKCKENENEEFVCPMDIPVGSEDGKQSNSSGEKLIVRRNSDPAPQEQRILDSQEEKTAEEIGAVSKEIKSLTVMLQEEKLLKNAPSTNV